jgi:co-chaperonin GroES (HSP10)
MVGLKTFVQPRNDLVLVRMDEEKTQTNGGIYLVGSSKVSTGTVLAVGPGAQTDAVPGYRMPMDLRVGERVYLGGTQFACEFVDGDERTVLVPEKLVLGTVDTAREVSP